MSLERSNGSASTQVVGLFKRTGLARMTFVTQITVLEDIMNLKIAMGLLVFSMIAAAGTSRADDNKKEDKTRTLTGCVQKGESAKDFALIAEDGSKWELEGNDVKLADHVGHKVTVQGKVEHAKDDAKTAVGTDAKRSGELVLRTLTMVSDTCK